MARVVHLTSAHSAWDTRIFWKECRSLARSGHEVILIAPHEGEEVREGIRVRPVLRPRSRLQRLIRTVPSVIAAALAERGDVYHLHDPELLPFVPLLRARHAAVIFDMHENTAAAVSTKEWLPAPVRGFLAKLYGIAEGLILRGTPTVLAEATYVDLLRSNAQHVVVQNLPVLSDLDPIRPPSYSVPTLGYMGALSEGRGCAMMLEAVKRLRQEGIPVRWECVGPINERKCRMSLEEARQSLGDDVVRLRGRLKQSAGWDLIARCHVGLALMHPHANYVGSYPTKMFEYMALGVPVVASNFPLYRQIIEAEGCGVCVDPTDSAAVASAVRQIVDQPTVAREMGERGREAVRCRYNWSSEEIRLLSLYASVLPGA